MAAAKPHPQSTIPNSVAEEIEACRLEAIELEQLLVDARNVVNAIDFGDLLTDCSADYDRHNTACGLLDMLSRHINAVENRPGTNLSHRLEAVAVKARPILGT